jgi:hypothetical protein
MGGAGVRKVLEGGRAGGGVELAAGGVPIEERLLLSEERPMVIPW